MSLEQEPEISNNPVPAQAQAQAQAQAPTPAPTPVPTPVPTPAPIDEPMEAQIQDQAQNQIEDQEANNALFECERSLDLYISNITENKGNNKMLLLNYDENMEKFIIDKIKDIHYNEVEPTSEDLFNSLTTEKSVPLLYINRFSPSSNYDDENIKVLNIIKQVIRYGQSVICTSDEIDFFTDNGIEFSS
jgi:hypothetical protein